MKQICLYMLLALITISGSALADTHYVVPANPNAQSPYTNWATAGTDIHEVFNEALAGAAPRVLWVTNGTYVITNKLYSNQITIEIRSVNGRDATILEGNHIETYGIDLFRAHYSVIDGFTLQNFDASAMHVEFQYGKVINCLFDNNNSGLQNSGGGLVLTGKKLSGSLVSNCLFRNNYADYYGGGALINPQEYGSNMSVVDCQFINNKSRKFGGGGLCFLAGNNSIVSNCVAMGNTAENGAGIFFTPDTKYDASHGVLCNCTVISNMISYAYKGPGSGGGIYVSGSTLEGAEPVLITDCMVTNNFVDSYCWQGGGIYANRATVRNCLIAHNKATGGVADTYQRGGGLYLLNGMVESCTLAHNEAGSAGGGLFVETAGSGTNNIIYFNTAPVAANYSNTVGNTGLAYSCVTPAVDGVGNVVNEPKMNNPTGGDYRLRRGSPCENAGVNRSWMTAASATDLDGNKRILNTTVDIGTYELPPPPGTIVIVN